MIINRVSRPHGFILLLGTICTLAFAVQPVWGELLSYEPFAYDDGDLSDREGGIGFQSEWLQYDGAPLIDNWLVQEGSLSYPGLVTEGNHVMSPRLEGDQWVGLSRDLEDETDEEETKYLSFLVRPEGQVGQGAFGGAFGVILSTFIGEGDLLIGKGENSRNYVIETFFDEDIVSSQSPIVAGETSLIVVKVDLVEGADEFTMYVNPPLGQGEPAEGVVKNDLDIGIVSSIAVAAAGAVSIDELRWGDTFEDVTPFDMPTVPGDFDGDGMLTAADIDALTAAIPLPDPPSRFDLDGNGAVDANDRSVWVRTLKKTWFGDANLDGIFNTQDLIAVFTAGQYEDNLPGNSTWATGDWDGDREFASGDLLLAFQDGGFEVGPRASIAAVPEPTGSVSLVLVALLGLACRSARRVAA